MVSSQDFGSPERWFKSNHSDQQRIKTMINIFTDHPRDTENPQSYFQHGKFAFTNSALLIWAGIVGIIHAIFPWWFAFYTSTRVIKSFKKIVDSKRHKAELRTIMPNDYLQENHLRYEE
tara:strand:- start:140 stop:496 length:357 start_codon:yes stop_codon:yes gene_type:complete